VSFQWIIDRANAIEFDAREITSITTSRSGYSRTVSRGGQPWDFTVTLPDGPRWIDYRSDYANALASGRHTAETIQFNNPGHAWMFAYQGDMDLTGATATYTQGNSAITVQGGTGSGYRFRAGDLIELGSYVYKVVSDVLSSSTQVTLHRPVIEASGSGVSIAVGADCEFSVKCVEFPRPVFFAINQVGWSGPFRFVENIT